MKLTQTILRSPAWACSGLTTALILAIASLGLRAQETGKPKEFSKPVIDIGIVVRDAEKSGKFYTEAVGFTEVKGFSVTGELGKKIGLIDNHPVDVRVFVLGEGELATRIKLLSFPGVTGKSADRAYIHSAPGINYLTLYVTSTDQALERLKKAGVKPLGETPLSISTNVRLTTFRDPDGNFIELIGP
jgi:lactoylglutathione lyase